MNWRWRAVLLFVLAVVITYLVALGVFSIVLIAWNIYVR